MVKVWNGFGKLKAKETLALLVKLSPELDWKFHVDGAWYSCNDFAKGGDHLLALGRLEVAASDINRILQGIKLHAEIRYNNIAAAVDNWFNTFENIEPPKLLDDITPEQSKEANPDITILDPPKIVKTNDFEDCRHY